MNLFNKNILDEKIKNSQDLNARAIKDIIGALHELLQKAEEIEKSHYAIRIQKVKEFEDEYLQIRNILGDLRQNEKKVSQLVQALDLKIEFLKNMQPQCVHNKVIACIIGFVALYLLHVYLSFWLK